MLICEARGCNHNYDFDYSEHSSRPSDSYVPKWTDSGVQVSAGVHSRICLIRQSCDEIRLDAVCPGAAQLFVLEPVPDRPPKRPTEFLQSSPPLFHIS